MTKYPEKVRKNNFKMRVGTMVLWYAVGSRATQPGGRWSQQLSCLCRSIPQSVIPLHNLPFPSWDRVTPHIEVTKEHALESPCWAASF